MASTPGSASLSFPPLPPLPSLNSVPSCSSAPPTATRAVSSQSVRIRTRRSRVSFREDVDIAYASAQARSGGRPCSGPPAAASTIGPSLAGTEATPVRRSSADNFQQFKPQFAPRPVLKRAQSSQALKMDRNEILDAFRPQTLRYPKVSPALARLSDGSIASSPVWMQSGASAGGSSSRKSAQFCSSPTTIASSSPVSQSEPTPLTTATNATSNANAAGRKARKPRSPIPSWSSAATCPSLVSSSHRASLASTLTAPSMTSLLLSPPSPSDHISMMPSPAFIEDAILHSPHYSSYRANGDRDGGDDMSDFDIGGHHNGSGNALGKTRVGLGESDGSWFDSEKARPSKTRFRPRRSGPLVSSAPCDNSPLLSSPPPPPQRPRASERLLKLQLSLADLRMQRRAEEDRQAAASRASEGRRPSRALSPVASPPLTRAPSPTLGDLIRRAPREEPVTTELLDDSDDESDLDLSLPPLNAALRSHVIPSSSRLLVSQNHRSKSAMGDNVPEDLGWSGSESEEEEFSRTVARIARRKTGSLPAASSLPSTGSLPSRRILKKPSFTANRMSRYSDFGMPSPPSTMSSPSTPSVDSVSPMASRRSTASSIASGHASGTAALINALVEQKYASQETLPRPKRFVEGWGAPEVLHDDEWPPDNHDGGQLETLNETW